MRTTTPLDTHVLTLYMHKHTRNTCVHTIQVKHINELTLYGRILLTWLATASAQHNVPLIQPLLSIQLPDEVSTHLTPSPQCKCSDKMNTFGWCCSILNVAHLLSSKWRKRLWTLGDNTYCMWVSKGKQPIQKMHIRLIHIECIQNTLFCVPVNSLCVHL